MKNFSDVLSAEEASDLLINTLCYDIPRSTLNGPYGLFNREPFYGVIDFTQFESLYNTYKSLNYFHVSTFSKIKRFLLKYHLSNQFIANFIQLRSMYYDSVVQEYIYDKNNCNIFVCKYCSYIDSNVRKLYRHIAKCPNRP